MKDGLQNGYKKIIFAQKCVQNHKFLDKSLRLLPKNVPELASCYRLHTAHIIFKQQMIGVE